ncbi:MAG: MBL fold metallo-hydrolase, partial [Bdellovibrionales bacterium]|nr:MBL fold metallo-hydrolase [Bdellovibrionales bacterium]
MTVPSRPSTLMVAAATFFSLFFHTSVLALPSKEMVQDLKVTVLSDMAISRWTHGEWGFSALVEAKLKDGSKKTLLFDTGGEPQTVLYNVEKINAKRPTGDKIDLCQIREVILSHNHQDHTMGLVAIRQHCLNKDPKSQALSVAYVGGPETFWPRPMKDGGDDNVMVQEKPKYEALGGKFVEYTSPKTLAPGLWLTGGHVPRPYGEKNWSAEDPMLTPDGKLVADTIPESQALVINTAKGLVVITGCGHAGLINILDYATRSSGTSKVYAAIGGFHLFRQEKGHQEGQLDWTAKMLQSFGVEHFLGAHCTGFDRVHYLRDKMQLDSSHAVISSIQTLFT